MKIINELFIAVIGTVFVFSVISMWAYFCITMSMSLEYYVKISLFACVASSFAAIIFVRKISREDE